MLAKMRRVTVLSDVDLRPHTTLLKGELGSIVKEYGGVDQVWGIDVLMDRYHKGLDEWDNTAHLVEPELSQVIECSDCRQLTIIAETG